MAGADARALAAFEKAFAADSNFMPAAEHLPQLLAERGDTAQARRVLARKRAASPRNPFVRLDELLLTGARDSTPARRIIADLAQDAPVPVAAQVALILAAQGPAKRWMSEAIVTAVAPRVVSEDDRRAVQRATVLLAGARADTAAVARAMADGAPAPELLPEVVAMAATGDAPAALGDALAAKLWTALPVRPVEADGPGRWDAVVSALAVRAWVERDRAALGRLARWLTPNAAETPAGRLPRTLLAVVQQADAALAGRPDVTALQAMDALLADPYFGLGFRHEASSWLAAQLWDAAGDRARAVGALERLKGSRSLAMVAPRERDLARWSRRTVASAPATP
jgi:hypothetical protein